MIRLVIVDDSKEITEIIESQIWSTVQKMAIDIDLEIIKYSNPLLLKYDLEERKVFDIYFIDIEMPEINGLDLAKHIRQKQRDAYIIFITSHVEFAINGYDLSIRAYQYILKSSMDTMLPKVVNDVLCEITGYREQFYIIKTNVRFEKVRIQDIIRIYKDGKNAVFVTAGDIHKDRKTLGMVLDDLDDPRFLQVERGNIVNIEHIDKITNLQIYLDNDDIVDISRNKVGKVKQKVNLYWRDNI